MSRKVKREDAAAGGTAERAHRQYRQRDELDAPFDHIADELPLIVWVHDASGGQMTVNRAFCEYFGVQRESMKGDRWEALLHPEDAAAYSDEFRRCLQRRSSFHAEVRVKRYDGAWRCLESWGRPRFTPNGEFLGYVGSSVDITDRKSAEGQLRESDKHKDEFLAMLGHELRNPLGAIRNTAEILRQRGSRDPDLRRTYAVLERQASQMSRIVDGLLDVSRIARGKIDLEIEVLDVRTIMASVLEVRASHAASRGLSLETDLGSEPLWIQGDETRLAQVFDNLLGNAIKFTECPGSITVTIRREGSTALIRVQDSGVGIRPDMLTRIFESFQQERQEVARATGGLGLGLALAKGLVELHQGTIEAHSAGPQTGAEFAVRLPLAPAPAPKQSRHRDRSSGPRRILIVEDNADAADMLRDLLESSGHDVTVSQCAPDALELLHRRGADVVLCDIGLPNMSGLELARAIRSDDDSALRAIPLIALTGYGLPEDRKRTAESGFDDHLVKPVGLQAVRDALERVSQRRL